MIQCLRERSLPHLFLFSPFLVLAFVLPSTDYCTAASLDISPSYVGIEQCKGCHKKEYESFTLYSKKSRSYESIERVKKGLSDQELSKCYGCHTTGYGKPGGFVSLEKTPHLKNAGCEVCHGPGGTHVRTKNRRHIKRKLSMEDCTTCHTSERVTAFRYKPLIHAGAH